MKVKLTVCVGVLVMLLLGMLGCDNDSSKPDSSARSKQPALKDSEQSAEQFLAVQKGKIVVLLMGMEGCPATRQATKVLANMLPDCPNDVVMARLDVAPPGKTLKPIANWPHEYFYAVDTNRTVAKRLDFFYYPTLYILDREGEVRYAGGCDKDKLKTMLSKIRAEKPGSKKKFYTPPLPAVGTPAAGFTAKTIKGDRIDLTKFPDKGATLLFFTSVECPFSRKDVKNLPALEKEFSGKGLTLMVIEKSTKAKSVKSFYDEIALLNPVIWDKDGAVSRKYSVEPVPFYFVIDKEGKIAGRGAYTEDSARQTLQSVLDLKSQKTGGDKKPTGAG